MRKVKQTQIKETEYQDIKVKCCASNFFKRMSI